MEEVKQIDSRFGTRDSIIVHLMLDAGLRASEVCKLTWDDVDFTNNLIRINNGKYNKSRIVPLAPGLKQLMQYSDNKIYRFSKYVVYNRSREQLTVNAIKLLFQRIKRETGITRIHAHLCRHTFATSYIVGGGNMEQLRIMLGHADYNVTQTYLHLAAQFELVHYPIYQLDPVFFRKGY
ncbi:MAG: tyrosine-type recombinase/integrase [Lachnospiraceae bacterium]